MSDIGKQYLDRVTKPRVLSEEDERRITELLGPRQVEDDTVEYPAWMERDPETGERP